VDILLLLIPVSVVLVALIGGVFWWSVKSGQFDDLEGPAHRILADDDIPSQVDNAAEQHAKLVSIKPGAERGQ
jgi:cbb3-type cytochrome oxidase maturation protein